MDEKETSQEDAAPGTPGKTRRVGAPERTFGSSLVVGAIGAFCVVYLFNPGAGFIELIPDNIPIFGNLDEAAAVLVLLRCLTYFGIDLSPILGRWRTRSGPGADDAIDVEAVGEDERR